MKQHKVTLLTAAIGPMTAAERAKGRYMRAPDGHWGRDEGKSAEEIAQEVKTHLDNRFKEVDARLMDVEQKAVRKPGGEYVRTASAASSSTPRA